MDVTSCLRSSSHPVSLPCPLANPRASGEARSRAGAAGALGDARGAAGGLARLLPARGSAATRGSLGWWLGVLAARWGGAAAWMARSRVAGSIQGKGRV